MSYNGPMLIKEPELRWPIVLLAALITMAIALLVATMHFVALTTPLVNRSSQPQFEWMLQPGHSEFDQFRQQISIEQLMGNEKLHPFNNLAVELTGVVKNETGQTISGLEMRGAIMD